MAAGVHISLNEDKPMFLIPYLCHFSLYIYVGLLRRPWDIWEIRLNYICRMSHLIYSCDYLKRPLDNTGLLVLAFYTHYRSGDIFLKGLIVNTAVVLFIAFSQ